MRFLVDAQCVNRVLVLWFDPLFRSILTELTAGQRLVEVGTGD
jgi:hypothetical protein